MIEICPADNDDKAWKAPLDKSICPVDPQDSQASAITALIVLPPEVILTDFPQTPVANVDMSTAMI